jgi:hypothetical protein
MYLCKKDGSMSINFMIDYFKSLYDFIVTVARSGSIEHQVIVNENSIDFTKSHVEYNHLAHA